MFKTLFWGFLKNIYLADWVLVAARELQSSCGARAPEHVVLVAPRNVGS